ncbi:MAG: alginate export family protein [Cytophagaceae bacterium]
MKIYYCTKLTVFLLVLAATPLFAQLNMTAQVRTRTEYRDGQGTLSVPNASPTVFTNQRTRLNIGFNADRYRLFTAVQDVRVWGMDASSIGNSDGQRFFMHEGWAEIIFNDTTFLKGIDNLSLKVGRQEIVYDDARLLGNLDWLQQGRRHDAAIIRFKKGTWWADAGFAFNQHREKKNQGTVYVGVPYPPTPGTDSLAVSAPASSNFIGTHYKSFQYLYLAKEIGFTRISGLFFKDDFQKPGDPAKRFTRSEGVNSRITGGVAVFSKVRRKHVVNGYFYYQGNNDVTGNTMDAYMAGANVLLAAGRKLSVGPGVDYLSGNDLTKPSKVNRRFDPLYGTPHKFWGLMDYFYVADPYGLNGNNNLSPGLINAFLNVRYKMRDNLLIMLDIHEFYAGNKVPDLRTADPDDKMESRLGTEIDLILNYSLAKQVNVEAGYAVMFGTETLDRLKAPAGNKSNVGQWAYLQLNIRTDLIGGITDKLKALTKDIEEINKKINQQ